ncbi:MAG: cytidylyltransferase domain-containing protein [Brevinematia bacterium]
MIKEIDAIIQARIDSTRLPAKAVLPLAGRPLIAHIVERLSLSKYLRNIIIATTEDSIDTIKKALSNYDYIKFFVGSKNNVLERYFKASEEFNSRIIVRATGDNPLVCPEFMDRAIEIHLNADADLTHYLGIPLGTGVEVIKKEALKISYKSTKDPYNLEHVTPFIYKNRDSFKVLEPLSSGFYYAPDIRVTVDTPEDYERVSEIFNYYKDKTYISMDDIIKFHQKKNIFPTKILTPALSQL